MLKNPESLTNAQRLNEDYFAYSRAYRAAYALQDYLYERWRNDPVEYRTWFVPRMGDKFEMISRLA
jgi:hypothetical protein